MVLPSSFPASCASPPSSAFVSLAPSLSTQQYYQSKCAHNRQEAHTYPIQARPHSFSAFTSRTLLPLRSRHAFLFVLLLICIPMARMRDPKPYYGMKGDECGKSEMDPWNETQTSFASFDDRVSPNDSSTKVSRILKFVGVFNW